MDPLFRILFVLAALGLSGAPADAASPQLETAVQVDDVTNAVTTAADGTVFVGFPRVTGEPGVKLVKMVGGKPVPFPDDAWNGWKRGADFSHALVRFNAMRIGPDGKLWVVDVGSPAIGEPMMSGASRILVFDPASGALVRTFAMPDSVVFPHSFIDDLRFNGDIAYVSDAGIPGLIVLDLKTGATRRVLDRQPSTTDQQPMRSRGRMLYGPDGKDIKVHSDQLEVSPDGKYLYYMPSSGPLYRILTSDVADPTIPDVGLEKRTSVFAKIGSTGGTAIDGDGNLYVSDTDRSAILKITPYGFVSTLIQDPRLDWPDAMWIDAGGNLWIPASQMDRTPAFNAGHNEVQKPVQIFKLPIGAKPSPRDHS